MTEQAPRVEFRADVLAVPAYKQGAGLVRPGFKLSSNESPWTPLPAILEAVQQCDGFNRYANPQLPELRAALAAEYGVQPEQIQFGAGSVAILYQLIHAVAGHADNYVYAWPSFEAYPLLGLASGAEKVAVPLTADARHDLDAMAEAITESTRAVLLCTPNNPTGPIITTAEFVAFMAKVPETVLVVLDEAYAEFVRHPDAVSGVDHLAQYPNLVVLRTFAKAQGIAGLRLGYGFAHPQIWAQAAPTAMPLSVSVVADIAGRAALGEEAKTQMAGRVQLLVNRREALLEGMRALGLNPPDAQGNFIWLPQEQLPASTDASADASAPAAGSTPGAVADRTAPLDQAFRDAGVLVRRFPNAGLRISVGEAESVPVILDTLRDYLAAHA